ncbi:MAG: zf-HC2 domain-containing protein [Planctomycetes bacterium]|nr:zf-HC2 domain-containing protein [Planctomycetota bacterium]
MTCEDVFRRLDDFLDRRLMPDEARLVLMHLEVCARCASEVRFEETALAEIRAKIRRLDVPPDLLERISRALESSPPTPSDDENEPR